MSYLSAGQRMNSADMNRTSVTTQHPSSALLLIDSEDRNVSTVVQVGGQSLPEYQPWNNFVIQTPDRLMTGAVSKVMLKSVRFPWYIPNITERNNRIRVEGIGDYTVNPGFYTPQQLVTALNAYPITPNGITWVWSDQSQQFLVQISAPALNVPFSFVAIDYDYNVIEGEAFLTQPSLAKTMGFTNATLGITRTTLTPGTIAPAGPADCLYTHYVDIVSTRLLQYRYMLDGASKNANKKALVTRIYCANETSTNQYDPAGNIIPIGTKPFVIHRKVEEKGIKWNPEGTIDSLD
ncbi:MAG: hypothetical protein EBR82_74750, partial [Caulobacteraceae bacterium]|nr:hypothetical protein [Caulobacteraceae bacterium]